MKTLLKMTENAFKIYIFLLGLCVISCGSRNSSNSSGYKSTTVSYYADKFNGNRTASRETYRHSKMTAAHK